MPVDEACAAPRSFFKVYLHIVLLAATKPSIITGENCRDLTASNEVI
jgi:hypothetical protein